MTQSLRCELALAVEITAEAQHPLAIHGVCHGQRSKGTRQPKRLVTPWALGRNLRYACHRLQTRVVPKHPLPLLAFPDEQRRPLLEEARALAVAKTHNSAHLHPARRGSC